MRTIGTYLREARESKNLSRHEVENETKIKTEFIEAIEKEEWTRLPDFSVVVGFVKSIASSLDLNPASMAALLRRDYPPKKTSVNPKPDVTDRFIWGPKLTFFIIVGFFVLMIGGYLIFQYVKFVSPPNLQVDTPAAEQVITKRTVVVSGKTDPEAVVKVNNQPVLVNENGKFQTELDIFEGTNEIVVLAISRAGKETVVRVKIKPELK